MTTTLDRPDAHPELSRAERLFARVQAAEARALAAEQERDALRAELLGLQAALAGMVQDIDARLAAPPATMAAEPEAAPANGATSRQPRPLPADWRPCGRTFVLLRGLSAEAIERGIEAFRASKAGELRKQWRCDDEFKRFMAEKRGGPKT